MHGCIVPIIGLGVLASYTTLARQIGMATRWRS